MAPGFAVFQEYQQHSCEQGAGCNYTVILEGWFGDLADLRQEDESTASYLLDWIGRMVRPTHGSVVV